MELDSQPAESIMDLPDKHTVLSTASQNVVIKKVKYSVKLNHVVQRAELYSKFQWKCIF